MNTTAIVIGALGILLVLFMRWLIQSMHEATRQAENAKRLRESGFNSSTFRWTDLGR
jgi:hypothetical protein